MTLKVRILRCLRRLFLILVSLTMTWFNEKMLISTRFIHGFMSDLIKKSWTDSNAHIATVFLWTSLDIFLLCIIQRKWGKCLFVIKREYFWFDEGSQVTLTWKLSCIWIILSIFSFAITARCFLFTQQRI